MVSASRADGADQYTGIVYAFTHSGSTWQQTDTLEADAPKVQDFFGRALDLDYPYAVIARPGDDLQAVNGGAALVFRHQGGDWKQIARLASPIPATLSNFGFDVAIAGEHVAVTQFGDPRLSAEFER